MKKKKTPASRLFRAISHFLFAVVQFVSRINYHPFDIAMGFISRQCVNDCLRLDCRIDSDH